MSTNGNAPLSDDVSRQPRGKVEMLNFNGEGGSQQVFVTTRDMFDLSGKEVTAKGRTAQWGGRMDDSTVVQLSKDWVTITSRNVANGDPEDSEEKKEETDKISVVARGGGRRLGGL